MTYGLEFLEVALNEWNDLDRSVKAQIHKVLKRRLEQPEIPSAALAGMPGCYKIKLRASGYRLIYKVIEDRVVVLVISVGKRERSKAYRAAIDRLTALLNK